jgi:hypothetical protein
VVLQKKQKKEEEEKEEEKGGPKPEVTLCGCVTQDAQGAHPLLLVLLSCVFPLPPYPCSTFALCFQQL